MSGIFGLFNRNGAAVDPGVLHALGATLAFRGLDGDGYWHEGPVGLGCQINRITPESSAEIQPARDNAGRTVVFDGRLDNREELLSLLEVAAGAPDSAFVLAAYDRWGESAPEHLTGDFAIALWDSRLRQLLLVRDQIGLRPLYYFCGRDLCVFGTELKAVLAHPAIVPEPDLDMLADLVIRDRQDLWGISFFRDIVSLPPGHSVRITAEKCEQGRYWDFDPARQLRLKSNDEYVEAFRELWFRAIRCRMRSRFPVMVSLSGGVDSSSVFCTAEVLRRTTPGLPDVLTISQLPEAKTPGDEYHYVQAIEQMYQVKAETVPMVVCPRPLDSARQQVWHSEGPWFDLQHENMPPYFHRIRELGARVILGGHWGDQMLAEQAYLLDLLVQYRWRETFAHLREMPRWFTDADPKWFTHTFYRQAGKLLTPHAALLAYRFVRDHCRRRQRDRKWYTESFRRRAQWSGWDYSTFPVAASHRAQYLYQLCRSRHIVGMEQNFKRTGPFGLEMWHPFLDRDLIAFLMAIPGEEANPQGVPKGILRRAMAGIIPACIAQRKWKADFTFLENNTARAGFKELCALISAKDAAIVEYGLVHPGAVAAELATLERKLKKPQDCNLAWELTDLLSIELWFQIFFRDTLCQQSTTECAYATVR